jgi:hypothetical protein
MSAQPSPDASTNLFAEVVTAINGGELDVFLDDLMAELRRRRMAAEPWTDAPSKSTRNRHQEERPTQRSTGT